VSNATSIEWTDATWNPIGGCSIKSPGCKPCYAMQLAGTRLHKHPLYAGTTTREKGRPVFNGLMTAAADGHDVWGWPVRWRGAKAPKLGPNMPSLIFVGDMADLFHENRPQAAIDWTMAGILYSRHIGQLLTKRAEEMADYLVELRRGGRWHEFTHPLLGKPNFAPETTFEAVVRPRLWLGVSAERQPEFDERWPYLWRLAEMGFTIFLSYEAAMGPLHLPDTFLSFGKRAQVIAGGVSGPWPWAPNPDWFRHIRDQCAAAGVPFFFKQWGEWAPAPHKRTVGRQLVGLGDTGRTVWMERVGKKAAGAQLDGREHREFPST